jgi:hypothetical protein
VGTVPVQRRIDDRFVRATAVQLRGVDCQPSYESDRSGPSLLCATASTNPLPWTEHWIKSKGVQVAPQETEVESYIIGGIKQDISENAFAGFFMSYHYLFESGNRVVCALQRLTPVMMCTLDTTDDDECQFLKVRHSRPARHVDLSN